MNARMPYPATPPDPRLNATDAVAFAASVVVVESTTPFRKTRITFEESLVIATCCHSPATHVTDVPPRILPVPYFCTTNLPAVDIAKFNAPLVSL